MTAAPVMQEGGATLLPVDAHGVAELRLDRAPCNEIGTVMLRDLERALEALDLQRTRALLVTSALPQGFCAGADLRELLRAIEEGGGVAQLTEFLDRIHGVMNRLDTLPIPTVGAIHGVCFGGGFELALTCDVLVADVTARFCFPELRLGLIPGFGGIPRLKREVGNALIRDLLFTGRSVNAKKAASVGLVSQVVARGRAAEIARATAQRAAQFDGAVLSRTKSFVKELPLAELEREKAHFKQMFTHPRVLEALRRFASSRDLRPYL